MSLAGNLTAGVLSSILAVIFVELYFLVRRRLTLRPLRKLIGATGRVGIVVPDFPLEVDEGTGALLALHDAFALAHILETCSKLKVETVITSSKLLPDDLPVELISIGGPFTNRITKAHLEKYCPGFSFTTAKNWTNLFRVGELQFQETEVETWGFIIKLGSDITSREGEIFLLWGGFAMATAASAFYFATRPDMLVKARSESFVVAINVNRGLGYRVRPINIVDCSTQAFASGRTPKP